MISTNKKYEWHPYSSRITFEWSDTTPVRLTECTMNGATAHLGAGLPIAEIMTTGCGHIISNDRLSNTVIGRDLRYISHRVTATSRSNCLEFQLHDIERELLVTVTYEMKLSSSMIRTFVTLENANELPVRVESITSLMIAFSSNDGVPDGDPLSLWDLTEADYTWVGEGVWHTSQLRSLLPIKRNPRGEHSVISTGTWSTGKHAPLFAINSKSLELTWIAQVEHNGPWRWEIGESYPLGYMALSGPESVDHDWSKMLYKGDSFTTVPASFTLAASFDDAMSSLTSYRRAWRIPNQDNKLPKVIFNDFMNTINGDPTTEKLLPLVKDAALIGVDVFCIDCGWYDDMGDWWPSVGEWNPSPRRFPHGLREVTDSIRSHGMIAGIWLEPEAVGVESVVALQLPDECFLQRGGQRVVEDRRYMLDFRIPRTIQHLNKIIRRLVEEEGIGYFKFDYNMSNGLGTDRDADTTGDGLLENLRAYTQWIDDLHREYPALILENCSSGGMREDYRQTSRFQVQSTSDQTDWRLYPVIASTAGMMMLPEQAGNWAYPQADMDERTMRFTLNTTMLGRFFLSGYLNRMDDGQRKLIQKTVDQYKTHVQPLIGKAVPFWPLGLPDWNSPIVAYGLMTETQALVTVWVREFTSNCVDLKIPWSVDKNFHIEKIDEDADMWLAQRDPKSGCIHVATPMGVFDSQTFKLVCD